MESVRRRAVPLVGVAALSFMLFFVATTALNSMPPPPVTPIEVVASGLGAPIGIAVSPTGAIVVSDRRAGTVTQLGASGQHALLASGLQRPVGLAFQADGSLLIVEERGGRLLERHLTGSIVVRASGLSVPRWVAVSPDGAAYVSGDGPGGDDDDDDPGASGGMRVMKVSPTGVVTIAGQGFIGLQGLALGSQGLALSMRRLATETAGDWTRLALLPFVTPGSFGPAVRLLSENMSVPAAVAVDRFGAVYMTAAPSRGVDGDDRDNGDGDDEQDGVLLKRLPTGELVTLATGLAAPYGIAIEADGHVLVAEQRRGRVLRLRAPGAPIVHAPAFTNQSPATITGTAEPGSRVQVFRDGNYGSVLGATTADAGTGAFTVTIALTPNAPNPLVFMATAAAGAGLTSTPVALVVVHDDRLPTTTILAPPVDLHTNGMLAVTGRGEDDASGVATVSVAVDHQSMADASNTDPTQPFVAQFGLATTALTEGPHTLTVTTRDRATNTSFAAQTFVVDRTAPETQIVSGPGATTAETSVTFGVGGTDAIAGSDSLVFSWRIDQEPWSAFGPDEAITITGLTFGAHRFEVKARDMAGNEDPVPAVQTFSVAGLVIRMTEPVEGALVTGSSVWVRGTVESGGREVTVSVNRPTVPDALPVMAGVEAGTFAVEVAVNPAITSLLATVTDVVSGATATHTITLTMQVDPDPPFGFFKAYPAGGAAPHVVRFDARLNAGDHVALDLESDGVIDFEGSAVDGQAFAFLHPGIYVSSLRVTASNGQVRTLHTSVEVYDPTALDARLQAVWSGFTDALRVGNLAQAVSFIHGDRRARWHAYLSDASAEALAESATAFTSIELVEVGLRGAEYQMLRDEGGQLMSYPVVFTADSDGRWRLWQF